MKPIPLFNLQAQHKPLRRRILQSVQRAVDGCQFILGEEVRLFEQEFAKALGVRHCVGVSSGSKALHLALEALGVGPGDEVITTACTFVATSQAVLSAGAKLVFADADPRTCNIDPREVEKKITRRTRAVIAVHLYGYPADLDSLREIAKRRGLALIEDCAQAHLTRYKGRIVGGIGDIGCFSFYPGKNLGACGDAGAVVTQSEQLAQKLRLLRNNGSDPVDKYRYLIRGYNSRLDNIQAGILRIKLRHLAKWTEKRRGHARLYRRLLKGFPLELPPEEKGGSVHSYHLFCVQADLRDALAKFLNENGVSTGVYYPIPLHLQPAYDFLGHRTGDFPNTERISQRVLALPIFPELKDAQIRYIAGKIREFYKA